jgi:hypothetical protein
MTDPDGLIRKVSFQSTGSLRKDIKCISRGNFDGAGQSLPALRKVNENEKMDFCIEAVPGWSTLPDSIMVATQKFSSGDSSSVCKVYLHGPGAEAVQPSACVYRFMGNLEDKHPKALQYNENFVVSAGDLGCSEKVYATKGMHRCTEFCKGRELFAGEESHFIAAMFWGKLPRMDDDNSPANCSLMQAIGKTVGLLHNMPLTWLSDVVDAGEFAQLRSNLNYFPALVSDELIGISTRLRTRVIACLPKSGWFAEPVTLHTDMHPANMLMLSEGVNIVRLIDWEGLTVGYRGCDLSYFFLCCHGSTFDSRRAFASGYLGALGQPVTDESIIDFLVTVEKCMPVALAINLALMTCYMPVYRPNMTKLLKRALQVLETDVVGRTSGEIHNQFAWIVEEGLVPRLLHEGAGSACCCSLQ